MVIGSQVTIPPIPHGSIAEKLIVGRLVTDLLAAGYSLTIWNGGDEAELEHSKDAEAIFSAVSATDEDEIIVEEGEDHCYAGWIRLIWGNDECIVSDYSMRLADVMKGSDELANALERQS